LATFIERSQDHRDEPGGSLTFDQCLVNRLHIRLTLRFVQAVDRLGRVTLEFKQI